jgi:hypothetical protein
MTLLDTSFRENVHPKQNGTVVSHIAHRPKGEKELATTKTEELLPTINGPQDIYGSAPKFELEEHAIDEIPEVNVAVIGGGIAGITAGVILPAKVPGINLRIYEKNADVVSAVAEFKTSCVLRANCTIRAARGMRMFIQAYAVMFQPMCIRPHLNPTHNGRRNSLVVPRSKSTGKG